jgi:hypothetical protein
LGEKLLLAVSLDVKKGEKGVKTPFGKGCFQNRPKIITIIFGRYHTMDSHTHQKKVTALM